jgi:hypothetical protein
MNKQEIIEKTVNAIRLLPQEKAEEISAFADFIFKRYEESQITESIQKLSSESKVFDFLNEEEELYTVADLKIVYNG